MNLLIVGAGKIGHAITAQLSKEGHDLTLIDKRPEVLEAVQSTYDINTIAGNGASLTILKEAGVKEADVLIAVSNADEINLLACITAATLNPSIQCIARIRDPEYAAQAYQMAGMFHLALVINPEKQTAAEIASLIKMPGTLHRETFAKARIEIVELRVEEGSRLDGKKLSDLEKLVHSKVLVCAVERGGKTIMPDGAFVLKAGDKFSVTAYPEQLHNMLASLGIVRKDIHHVLIAGGGRISFYLAEQLDKMHITTTLIEKDRNRCELLAERLPHSRIVHGDASSQAFLDEEDLEDYDALVSMTGLDEMNIVISMYGALRKVPLTITKVSRGENIQLLNDLPIGPVVCPKDLVTMHIVRYIRAMERSGESAVVSIHKIADGSAEALELVVDEHTKYAGRMLKDIPVKKNILFVSIRHGAKVSIADGSSIYQPGDTIVIMASQDEVIRSINDIFAE